MKGGGGEWRLGETEEDGHELPSGKTASESLEQCRGAEQYARQEIKQDKSSGI